MVKLVLAIDAKRPNAESWNLSNSDTHQLPVLMTYVDIYIILCADRPQQNLSSALTPTLYFCCYFYTLYVCVTVDWYSHVHKTDRFTLLKYGVKYKSLFRVHKQNDKYDYRSRICIRKLLTMSDVLKSLAVTVAIYKRCRRVWSCSEQAENRVSDCRLASTDSSIYWKNLSCVLRSMPDSIKTPNRWNPVYYLQDLVGAYRQNSNSLPYEQFLIRHWIQSPFQKQSHQQDVDICLFRRRK